MKELGMRIAVLVVSYLIFKNIESRDYVPVQGL
jgi:hypothetical protein